MSDFNLGVGKINITEAQLREVLKQEIKKADSNMADEKVDNYVNKKIKDFLEDGQISEDELQMIEDFAEDDAGIISNFTIEETPPVEEIDTRSEFEKQVDAELAAEQKEILDEAVAKYNAKVASVRAENATARANQIHAAIEGWGTDEKAVLSILNSVSDKELIEISNAYKELYGEDLEQEILDDFGGWFEGDTRSLIKTRFKDANNALKQAGGDVNNMDDGKTLEQLNNAKLESVADALHTAVKPDKWFGWGTDEEAFANTIYGVDLSPEEWQEVDKIYQEKYGESLTDAVKGDFSHRTEDAYLSFLASVGVGGDGSTSVAVKFTEGMTKEQIWEAKRQEEAKIKAAELHAAFDRWGTDEAALEKVLSNDLTKEEIRNIANAYEQMYGESLIDAVKGDTSGSYEYWYTTKIEAAMKDNTKDPIDLQKYGITDETKPEDIKPNYDAMCEALHTATSSRLGTDEKVIDQIIMQNGLTNEQLVELDDAYKKKYNISIVQLMKDENTGTYGKTLAARLKMAGLTK